MAAPKRVALVEDDQTLSATLSARLREAGILCREFTSRGDFKESIENGDPYDFVILDWFFEDSTSSTIAKLVLEDLRAWWFVPLFIYSEERDAVEAEIPTLRTPFNRARFFDKGGTEPAALVSEIQSWYESSLTARLCAAWRTARRAALERALYELDALEGEEFYRTLRNILIMEASQIPDVDHAMEFLERYVGRKVVADADLRELLRTQLEEALKSGVQAKGDHEPVLLHAHRYAPAMDTLARSGDIVEILGAEGQRLGVAVTLTPACDLANPKCFELRLVLAEDSQGKPTATSEWLLAALRFEGEAGYRNLTLNFHRTLFVRDLSIGHTKEERQGRRITYEHDFEDAFGKSVRLRPLCRLDDPYRSDLLQHFSSHASRIGTP